MKINLSLFPSALMLLGAIAPLSAQEDHHRQDPGQPAHEQQPGPENRRPEKPEEQRQQQPEERRQQQPQRPGRQESPQPQGRDGEHPNQQRQGHSDAPSWRRDGGRRQRDADDHHQAAWQGRRANDWKSEHRDWRERGGYRGRRIPEARYHGYFGPEHPFRIQSYPLLMVGGYPRFQYGGFWISVVDPWPEYWSSTWYDDDDVYVEYDDDGYYMRNRQYPEDRISISLRLH